jgi:hypothetical protein
MPGKSYIIMRPKTVRQPLVQHIELEQIGVEI